ncbi:MAG: hypothetical protein IPP17_30640 [Bacteroidetes bacterium]|nr:hypothetical protein [Bacteroidota bacterium]
MEIYFKVVPCFISSFILLGTLSRQLSGQWGPCCGKINMVLAPGGRTRSAVGWYAILWNPIPASTPATLRFHHCRMLVFWAFSSFGVQRTRTKLNERAFSGNLLFAITRLFFLFLANFGA